MLQSLTADRERALLDSELAEAELRADALLVRAALARRLRHVERERAQRSAKLAHARWVSIMLGEPLQTLLPG